MKSSRLRILPFLAALLMLVFFVACEKEEVETLEQTPITPTTTTTTTSPVVGRLASSGTQTQSGTSTEALEIECISIDYPFDFIADSVAYTMNTISDVEDFFNNVLTSTTLSVDFAYPLNVTLDDGSAAVVADENELSLLVSACVPGTGWGTGSFPAFFFDSPGCLSISYPVSLVDGSGVTATASDEMTFIDLLAANPNYIFSFPINVIDSSGTVVAVQNDQELFDLIAACASSGAGSGHGGNSNELHYILGEGCFDYNYPINLIDFNGAVNPVVDDNEFTAAILNGNFVDFEYGFSVTLEADGSQVVIADDVAFLALIIECNDTFSAEVDAGMFITTSLYDSCYTLIYPFDIDDDGSIVTISNEAEANSFILSGSGTIVLPVEIISNNQAVTVSSSSDFDDLLSNCSGPVMSFVPAAIFLSIGLDSSNCYGIIYPVTVLNRDGTTSTLSSETEATSYLSGPADGALEFPVDVIEISTSATVTLLGSADYFTLLDNC